MWSFKRKPKAKPIEPPPPPPPQPVEEKLPEPSWADRIAKVIFDRGAPLRDELDALIEAQPEEHLEPIISLVRPMFDRAHNSDSCPCRTEEEKAGAEKHPFKYCCKPRWKALKQMYADQVRARRQEEEAARQAEDKQNTDERTRVNTKWMVQIGCTDKGQFVMEPMEASKDFTMRQVCDAIEICAWQTREMIMMEAVKQQVMASLMRTAQQARK